MLILHSVRRMVNAHGVPDLCGARRPVRAPKARLITLIVLQHPLLQPLHFWPHIKQHPLLQPHHSWRSTYDVMRYQNPVTGPSKSCQDRDSRPVATLFC